MRFVTAELFRDNDNGVTVAVFDEYGFEMLYAHHFRAELVDQCADEIHSMLLNADDWDLWGENLLDDMTAEEAVPDCMERFDLFEHPMVASAVNFDFSGHPAHVGLFEHLDSIPDELSSEIEWYVHVHHGDWMRVGDLELTHWADSSSDMEHLFATRRGDGWEIRRA